MSELLRAVGLSCERDERVLFQQLSFSLNSGDILHVKGPNGAGKTTLLRGLAGLNQHLLGECHWHESIAELNALDGGRCWYLAHRAAVTLALTAEENLRYAAALKGLNYSTAELWQALEAVGLRGFEDVPCGQLSAGQQRRVALARLYLPSSNIPVWILDEPFTALDVDAVAQMEAHLIQFAEQGGAVLMTSHHGLESTRVRTLQLDNALHSVEATE